MGPGSAPRGTPSSPSRSRTPIGRGPRAPPVRSFRADPPPCARRTSKKFRRLLAHPAPVDPALQPHAHRLPLARSRSRAVRTPACTPPDCPPRREFGPYGDFGCRAGLAVPGEVCGDQFHRGGGLRRAAAAGAGLGRGLLLGRGRLGRAGPGYCCQRHISRYAGWFGVLSGGRALRALALDRGHPDHWIVKIHRAGVPVGDVEVLA
jgi:hypothetical protein